MNINNIDERTLNTLLVAVDNGSINIDDVQKRLDMKKRTEILEKHKQRYAITQGKDGNWRTYVPDLTKKNGRRQIKRCTEERLADALVEFYERPEKKEELTMCSLYPEWLKYYSLHTNADGTVRRVDSDWKKFYENDEIVKKPMNSFSKMQLDTWVHKKIKEYKMTKTCYYNMSLIIRQMMIYAQEAGYILNNPFANVKVNAKMFAKKRKPDSEEQVYTLEEEVLIIEQAWKDYWKKPEVTTPLAVILMFYFGVRVGEIVAFKETDVQGNMIEVNRMERRAFEKKGDILGRQTGRTIVDHTKSSAGIRSLFIIEQARDIIDLIIAVNKRNGYNDESFMFVNAGERIYDSAVRTRLEKYCKKANIVYRSPHKIRKTWISTLIDEGLNINTIRELAGHENERTTYNNYCFDRKTDKQRKEQMEKALTLNVKSELATGKLSDCA